MIRSFSNQDMQPVLVLKHLPSRCSAQWHNESVANSMIMEVLPDSFTLVSRYAFRPDIAKKKKKKPH